MEFYFKVKGEKMHLYGESGIFDDDLGVLKETFTGKLKTSNLFGENFELKISQELFQKANDILLRALKDGKGLLRRKFLGIGMF